MTRPTWEQWAMNLALAAASRSEDPYWQVGAVCLRYDNSVAACSYNGVTPGEIIDWSDRDRRREKVIHAEVNALRYVRPSEVKLIAVTLSPCMKCLTEIAAYRIPRIVYLNIHDEDELAIVKRRAEELAIDLHQLA